MVIRKKLKKSKQYKIRIIENHSQLNHLRCFCLKLRELKDNKFKVSCIYHSQSNARVHDIPCSHWSNTKLLQVGY